MSEITQDYEMSKLDLQRSNWLVVIGADFITKDFNKSIESLSLKGFTYYAILHDMDIKENGLPKYKHYHIVLCTSKRPKGKTILNLMTDTFGCSSDNVSISECFDLTLSIQYLCHKNDPLKYPYDWNNIITNDIFNDIEDIMKTKMSKIIPSTKSFITLIAKCHSRVDLIETLGVSTYAYYRNTINDLIRALGRFDLLDKGTYFNTDSK